MNQVATLQERETLVSESVEVFDNSMVWRIGMSQAARRISCYHLVDASGSASLSLAGCKKADETFASNVCFARRRRQWSVDRGENGRSESGAGNFRY